MTKLFNDTTNVQGIRILIFYAVAFRIQWDMTDGRTIGST